MDLHIFGTFFISRITYKRFKRKDVFDIRVSISFFFYFPICSCNFNATLDKNFKWVGISVLVALKIN